MNGLLHKPNMVGCLSVWPCAIFHSWSECEKLSKEEKKALNFKASQSMFRHLWSHILGRGSYSSCILWILNIFFFPKSIVIQYLLSNLRLPLKASVKNKSFFLQWKLIQHKMNSSNLCKPFHFFLTCSSGLNTQNKHVSSHTVISCHFTSDKDFSFPIATFSPTKFLNMSESVSVSCQLFFKVNSTTNNLWYENSTWSF